MSPLAEMFVAYVHYKGKLSYEEFYIAMAKLLTPIAMHSFEAALGEAIKAGAVKAYQSNEGVFYLVKEINGTDKRSE